MRREARGEGSREERQAQVSRGSSSTGVRTAGAGVSSPPCPGATPHPHGAATI